MFALDGNEYASRFFSRQPGYAIKGNRKNHATGVITQVPYDSFLQRGTNPPGPVRARCGSGVVQNNRGPASSAFEDLKA